MKRKWILLTLLIVAFAGTAGAADYKLTTPNTSVTINGAIFSTTDIQPTGTGVIDPFLKFQSTPTSYAQAYNYNQWAYTSKVDGNDSYGSGNWTRLLPTSALAPVTINGVNYWKFLLDIDQTGSSPYMSLDYLTFSTSADATIHSGITGTGNLSTLTFPNLGTVFYTLGDNHLMLDYKLDHGSGSGDLYVYVPVPATYYTYLYLANAMGYSAEMFNKPTIENDGPEEWAALLGQSLPDGGTTLTLLGCALVGLGVLRRRLRI